jgi:copper homeostasis protein
MKRLLEIAVFSEESAKIAADCGVERIELCKNYDAGGVSPSLDLIERVRKFYTGQLQVIVRPRPGHFRYSLLELLEMQTFISETQHLVDGFVIGALWNNGTIQVPTCKVLMAAAPGKSFTFHRAFDLLPDKHAGMQELIQLGFERVLSSGGKSSALEGRSELTALQREFGNSITLMPGGGIRSANAQSLLNTGCREFHSAACGEIIGEVDRNELMKLQKIFE